MGYVFVREFQVAEPTSNRGGPAAVRRPYIDLYYSVEHWNDDI